MDDQEHILSGVVELTTQNAQSVEQPPHRAEVLTVDRVEGLNLGGLPTSGGGVGKRDGHSVDGARKWRTQSNPALSTALTGGIR
jgi:hypothetical protein